MKEVLFGKLVLESKNDNISLFPRASGRLDTPSARPNIVPLPDEVGPSSFRDTLASCLHCAIVAPLPNILPRSFIINAYPWSFLPGCASRASKIGRAHV